MKLMHPLFSAPVCFAENHIQVLTVEHAPTFRELVLELTAQMEDYDGRFVLSESDQILDCGQCLHVIADYAHISEPDKRMQNKLIAALLNDAQEELAEETTLLCRDIQQYLGKLAALADYPVAYEQSENLAALLKAMEFRVELDGLPVSEALYEHIALYHRMMKNQCFILVHAKAFFSEEELMNLYKMAKYQKWNLLLLESHTYEKRLEGEQHRLFDKDLCELFLECGEDLP